MYKANLACGARVCHYVVEGKIYKCPVTAIGNILIDQFNVDPQAEQLLKSYKPIFYTDTDLVKRISNLPTEILEQCKLCPQFEEKDRFNLKNYFKISPVSIKKLNVSRRS